MGGRFLDFLAQGLAADRPVAAAMPALIVPGATAIYYANDTNILSFFNEDSVTWFDVDVSALASLSFETLPDVDWTTPPTDGQLFAWHAGDAKLKPVNPPIYWTTETLQDLVGAMVANGTGLTASYNDATGMLEIHTTITQYTDELAQDAFAALIAAGSHTGISFSYNDGGNGIDVTVTASYVNGLADVRALAAIAAASIGDLADVDLTGAADGHVLTRVAGAWASAAPASAPAEALFEDQKAAGTQGGTATSGAWTARVLNTVMHNDISGASLAANQITLPAGTYDVNGETPGYRCDYFKCRLQNITDGTTLLVGSSEWSANSTSNTTGKSLIRGRFTLAASKVLELQMRVSATQTTNGLGASNATLGVIDIFSRITIKKIA